MPRQSRFRSVESGDDIISQLYQKDPESKLFEMTITVAAPSIDLVEDLPLTLLVERLGDTPPSYTHPNGEAVLETQAYIESGGEPFTISLTPPIGDSDMQGATIITPPEMEEIITRYLRKRRRRA
ncbi:hypothetical protein GW930_00180 [Candidatus Saccharibacteria bacterium]|nr:hypothetical protein [Candidatus Saccharibacteria bacterium]